MKRIQRRSFFDIGHPSERKGTRGAMISGIIFILLVVFFTIISLLPDRDSDEVQTEVEMVSDSPSTNK